MKTRVDLSKTVQFGEVAKLLGADSKTRLVRYVLSSSASDRVNDTIAVGGWKLDNYKRNPVLLWGHQRGIPPIGKAVEIGVVGSQLEATYEFATAEMHPLADTVFRLASGGFCRAGSVGFQPIKYVYNDQTGGIDFTEQELLEFSACTVPCHPDALAVPRELKSEMMALEKQYPGAFTELRAARSASKPAVAAETLERYAARARHYEQRIRLVAGE